MTKVEIKTKDGNKQVTETIEIQEMGIMQIKNFSKEINRLVKDINGNEHLRSAIDTYFKKRTEILEENKKAYEKAVVNVTGVTLDKSTLSLEVGATATLNATIAPSNASYKAVSFTSSDDAIATVDDDGLVTAVKAGTADITVESLMDGSKTAKCTLTVTEPEPEPEVPEEPEE